MTSPRRRIAIVFAVVVVVDLLIFWRLRSSHGTAAGPAPHGSPSVSASGGASTPGSRPQPSWAVPYGREPWRKAVAAIPRGSKLEPGTPALANLMDRVSSAFRASPSGDGMEAAGSGYRARVANNGLGITALPPARPKVQPSGTALPDLKPVEATFHTLYVSRGTTRLYQESRAAADWSYSGNTVQALRTPDGGLIEHYEARRDGVEVTWYLSKAPAGSGPLVISARMEGLRYAGLTSGGMHFTDTQGTARVRVGEATVVDAGGRSAAVASAYANGSIRFEVPAAFLESARYPIAIDPDISPEFGTDQPEVLAAYEEQETPAVAWDGTRYLAVWKDSRRDYPAILMGARLDVNGAVLDPVGIVLGGVQTYQEYPSVAGLNGMFLAVWTDYRNGYADVYGTRVTSTGAVLDPAGLPIGIGPGSQQEPVAAALGNAFLVAYSDYHDAADASNGDITAARVSLSGSVVGGAPVTVCSAPGAQYEPRVAVAGNTALVAWTDERGGGGAAGTDIFGARIDVNGVVLDPGGRLLSSVIPNGGGNPVAAPGRQLNPSVAATPGGFLVVWTDERLNTDGDIYGTRVDLSGQVLNPGGFAVCNLDGLQAHPSIASDGTGYLVVWEDRRNGGQDLYGSRLDANGAVLDAAGFPVSLGDLNQMLPNVVFGGGQYLAVWEDNRSGLFRDVYGARISTTGSVQDPDGVLVTYSEAQQFQPGIGWNGSVFLVAWREFREADRFYLYATRVTTGGTVLDPDGIFVSDHASFNTYPAIGANAGTFLVAWEDQRPGEDHNILARRVGNDGQLLDLQDIPVCTAAGEQYRAAVVGTGAGWMVAWGDDRVDPNFDIYGAVVNASGVVTSPANGIPLASGAGLQFAVRLAFNGSRVLAVWRDTRNLPSDNPDLSSRECDIFGRLFTPAAVPVGTADLPICTVHQLGKRFPTVCSDGTGFLVAWEDGRAGDLAIYGTLINGNGTPSVANGRALAEGNGQKTLPIATWDGTHYLVVWRDIRSGSPAVYGRQLDTAGNPLGDPEGFLVADAAYGNEVPWVTGAAQQISLVAYQTHLPTQVGRIGLRVVNDSGHKPPAFTSTPEINVAAGTVYTYEVKATDPDTPAPAITALQLPPWLLLTDHGNGTATLKGTPQPGNEGPNRVILLASDGTLTAAQVFDLLVSPSASAPHFTSTPVTTATSGSPYSYLATASDPQGDAVVFSSRPLPVWLRLTDHGNGTASLTGTPSDADVGTHSIFLGVSDGSSLVGQAFTLTVAASAFPPQFTSDPVIEATKGQPYTYAIQAKGAPGKPLFIAAPVLPPWLTLMDTGNGTATLQGVPGDQDGGGFPVKLTVNDGQTIGTQAFTLSVTPIRITTLQRNGTDTLVCWESVPGRVYRLEWIDRVGATTWTEVATVTAEGNPACHTDQPGQAAQRFYRVTEVPPPAQ